MRAVATVAVPIAGLDVVNMHQSAQQQPCSSIRLGHYRRRVRSRLRSSRGCVSPISIGQLPPLAISKWLVDFEAVNWRIKVKILARVLGYTSRFHGYSYAIAWVTQSPQALNPTRRLSTPSSPKRSVERIYSMSGCLPLLTVREAGMRLLCALYRKSVATHPKFHPGHNPIAIATTL